jgi:E3 ubiquitin-protein ligase listerin
LPDELLSVVLEAPRSPLIDPSDIPLSLRSYLLGWILVFDHFENASFKVKNDYAENIKRAKFLPPLMDYITDTLSGFPEKEIAQVNVAEYEPNAYREESFDLRSILVHILFLSLKNVPSLVKSWWLECSSRQKAKAMESWTEKYVSCICLQYVTLLMPTDLFSRYHRFLEIGERMG